MRSRSEWETGSKIQGKSRVAAAVFPITFSFTNTAANRALIIQVNQRSDRAVGESSSTSGCSLVSSASFVVTFLRRIDSLIVAAALS